MDLVSFVRSLPKHWATAPIYANGAVMPNGKKAEGKSPLGRAAHDNLTPEFTAQHIEKHPEEFRAVGVYSGTRSGGLVIFDVDANLGAIEEKWGNDLQNAPRITSPKPHAAKFLFVVPEEDRLTVSDLSHAAGGHEGWEVLWGRQGLLFGAYKNEGEYTFSGDVNNIPAAPEWLLERMREQYRKLHERGDTRKLRDSRYSNRSREEKIEIARSCLSVIEPRGANSEQFWWEIGAMIHSELPNEDGLKLWEEWSRRDNEYADDWKDGHNPCARRWEDGFRGGGLGFGSLIRQADLVDPNKTRFQRDGLARLVEEIESTPIKYRMDYLSGEELLARAEELERTIENPALLDQAKTALAAEAGRHREGAAAIDRLLDTHLTFKRNNEYQAKDLKELDDADFEYIIPGILPKPWLLLVHADGGTGKSAMCQTLCKHISQARPFEVYGALEKLPKGRCLWLNGDQSERIVRRQFEAIGVESGVDVVGEWDMQWFRRFCKIQGGGVDDNDVYTPGKYDLIVIDSLDGCNDSNPYEENRREYALPLKRLARRNGQDFGACTIIVIHHNNRNGGFRGTSAIKAAVDETWNMQRIPVDKTVEMGVPASSRLITVEKSRDDREGHQMIFSLMGDFTYKISEVPETENTVKFPTPNQLMKDVLAMLRKTGRAVCLTDLVEDEVLGGVHKRRGLEHVLKRLKSMKLVERCAAPEDAAQRKGRPAAYYRATGEYGPGAFSTRSRACGVSPKSGGKKEIPSPGTDLKHTTPPEKGNVGKKNSETDSFSDERVFRQPRVVKNPSSASEVPISDKSHVLKVDDTWDAWD
jgi:hypothetical protein